jgi:small subunit ribosomal protein S6
VSRDYELAFILSPEVNEEETRAVLERVEQIVATYGGQIVKVNQWGRRRLAYPIQRHRDGQYIFIDMILTTETVAELERMLKVSEIVLRHMVRTRDPKAVQKEREERAEREARAAAAAAAASEAAAASAVAVAEAPAETSEAAASAVAVAEAPVETSESAVVVAEAPAETSEAVEAVEEAPVEAVVAEEVPAAAAEEEVVEAPPVAKESAE